MSGKEGETVKVLDGEHRYCKCGAERVLKDGRQGTWVCSGKCGSAEVYTDEREYWNDWTLP